jgi:hypothetical protein
MDVHEVEALKYDLGPKPQPGSKRCCNDDPPPVD